MNLNFKIVALTLVIILALSGNILSKFCNSEDHSEVESRFCPCCKSVDYLELPHDHAHQGYVDEHETGCVDIPIFANAELTESSRTKIKDKGKNLESALDSLLVTRHSEYNNSIHSTNDPPPRNTPTATVVLLI